MKNNPINPLNWVQMAQDWFTKTEKSSGFRPYLIYLLLEFGFAITLLLAFPDIQEIRNLCINITYIAIAGFVLLFAIKAFQDPGFCRSEKHIETVKRIELSEQKGDRAPVLITPQTTQAISNPAPSRFSIEEASQ